MNSPMRKTSALIRVLLVLAFSLFPISLSDFFVKRVVPESEPVMTLPQSRESRARVSPPAHLLARRAARLSAQYIFSRVKKNLETDRIRLAGCLLRNENLPSSRIQLTLNWEGEGRLKEVQLRPDAGNLVRDCLKDIIQNWSLSEHPGLQPFSYSTLLYLSS